DRRLSLNHRGARSSAHTGASLDPLLNVGVHCSRGSKCRPRAQREVEGRASVVCTKCGHSNPEDAHFCANCGNPLQEDTTVSFTPIEVEDEAAAEGGLPQSELEPGQALLVVQRGPNAGSKFLIDKDVTTVGRHPESDIFLDDVTVSRRHAEFERKDGKFFIRDVGSLNGT